MVAFQEVVVPRSYLKLTFSPPPIQCLVTQTQTKLNAKNKRKYRTDSVKLESKRIQESWTCYAISTSFLAYLFLAVASPHPPRIKCTRLRVKGENLAKLFSAILVVPVIINHFLLVKCGNKIHVSFLTYC